MQPGYTCSPRLSNTVSRVQSFLSGQYRRGFISRLGVGGNILKGEQMESSVRSYVIP